MTSESMEEEREDWREREKCLWALLALSAVYSSQSHREAKGDAHIDQTSSTAQRRHLSQPGVVSPDF